MKRRNLLGMFAAAGAMGANRRRLLADCGCAMQVQHSKAMPPGSDVFKDVGSKLRITEHAGVRRHAGRAHRAGGPALCVRQARNQPGRGGLGRSHARRQGGRGHGLRDGPEGLTSSAAIRCRWSTSSS